MTHTQKLHALQDLLLAAEASGLRYRERGIIRWEPGFLPLEYLQLSRDLLQSEVPEVRASASRMCR